MKRFLMSTYLLSSWIVLFSQDTIPLYPNRFSHQIQEALEARRPRTNRAAWEYTYISRQRDARQTYNEGESRWGFDTLTMEQLAYFRNYQAVNAREAILRSVANERIVLINESHIHPRHRHFVKGLLTGLKEAGFQYFGLEALSYCAALPENIPCDTSLNQRGYPLYSPYSGTYIREPQMSNLIREAIKQKFELFAYDQFGGAARDSLQARNIAAILEKDPEARIVVLCGYGHNVEVEDGEISTREGRMMGYHLKKMTGIDPFTINQHILAERKREWEVDLYRFINLPESSVFIDKNGKHFSGWPGTDDRFDMLVYHPRTRYVFERPDWLINDAGNRLYYPIKEMIRIDYPIIFKVWPEGDQKEAVPVDIIEHTTPDDIIPLILPAAGEYRLLLENPGGEKQEIRISIP